MKKVFLVMILSLFMVPLMAMPLTASAEPVYDTFITLENAGEQGIVSDGNYIYTCFWATEGKFGKYDFDGTFIENFTIEYVGGCRDLTYDGTYFYAGDTSNKLYQMDFDTKTLISTIEVPGLSIRHCTYDPDKDGFWVGDWGNLYFVNKSGSTLLDTELTLSSAYGSAYDNITPGGPYLWVFTQGNGSSAIFEQYDIANNELTENSIDASNIPEVDVVDLAGGAFSGSYEGKYALMGNIQQDPNIVVIYNLGDSPVTSATASLGVDTVVATSYFNTDASTAKDTDNIDITTTAGDEVTSFAASDFTVSSSSSSAITIEGVGITDIANTVPSDTILTIEVAKSVGDMTAYLWYGEEYIGEITLSSTVNEAPIISATASLGMDTVVATSYFNTDASTAKDTDNIDITTTAGDEVTSFAASDFTVSSSTSSAITIEGVGITDIANTVPSDTTLTIEVAKSVGNMTAYLWYGEEYIGEITLSSTIKTTAVNPSKKQRYIIASSTGEGGSISPDGRVSIRRGRDKTFTITPDQGYVISKVLINDKSMGTINEYTFTNIKSNHKIEAIFKAEPKPEKKDVFKDVTKKNWFYDDVMQAYDIGLMLGVNEQTFNPQENTTRAMVITMLWRLEKSPVVSRSNPFNDMENDEWFTNAVKWGLEKDIINGYSSTLLGPNDPITREQVVTIINRYAIYKGYKLTPSVDLINYVDSSQISTYALNSMKWAVAEGLIEGRTAVDLYPQDKTSRAEIATILMRFIRNIAN